MQKRTPVLRLGIVLLSLFLLCGCGTRQYDWVLTIDGTPVAPGLYRLFQIQAYSEAAQNTSNSDKLFSQTIGGKSTQDWIADRTADLLCTYYYYETQFASQELSFTEAQQADMDARIAADWAQVSAIYTRNGVAQADFYSYDKNSFKAQALFTAAYADVSNNEVRQFLDQNFARLDYVQLPLTGTDGALSDQTDEAITRAANAALASLRRGTDWTDTARSLAAQCYRLAGFSVDSENLLDYLHTSYINLSTTSDSASESLAAAVSAAQPGEYGVFRAEDAYLVLFRRQPNYSDEEEFSGLRTSVLYQMKGDEFSDAVSAACANCNVLADADALRFYSPQKLDLSSGASSSSSSG